MSAKLKELQQRAFDNHVRLGTIFHIPTMIVDPEGIDCGLADFLNDDLDDRVLKLLEPACPGLKTVVDSAWSEYEENKEFGRSDAENCRLYSIAEFLMRCLTLPYIICVQHQIVKYHSRDGRFPLGTLSSGWGYLMNVWVAAKSPEDALRQGIKLSIAHQRIEWNKAPKRKPLPAAETPDSDDFE